MHIVRIGRVACGMWILLCLAACGGGGDPTPTSQMPPPAENPTPAPGTPNPPSGSLPTFAISGTSLTFSAPIPNHTPDPQRIPVTISGVVNGKLYVVASVSDGTVVSASTNVSNQPGQTPTVDVRAVPATASSLLRGTYSSVITLIACVEDPTCQTGQLPGSPQTVNVMYTIRADVQGDLVGPRVVPAGTAGSVYLRGRGLGKASQVSFGSTAATAVKVAELDGDTEVLATYPALTPGTYPISINAGAIAFTASLIVVSAPNYSATQLTYPATPVEIGGILYDAQRQAFYVAARYSDSQSNRLFKFQFSSGAWQAPASVSVPALQDLALSADGTTLLLLTDNSLVEFDAASFTQLGSYTSTDELVRAGTAYMQNLAVANDGYAVITTGGANPSNTLLYSALTHTFVTINSSNGNLFGAAVDPRLYFGNPAVSADGALVALTQDPRTAAALPTTFTKPFLYLYGAVGQQRPSYFGSPSSPFTDKDRSRLPRSSKPAVNNIPGTLAGTRIVVNGPSTVVLGGDFSARGLLPDSTRAAVFKPDAMRVYTFDAPPGTESGELRTFDVSVRLVPSTQFFTQVGTGIPMSPGAGSGALAMTISPDGGTLFVAGVSGVLVQPAPQ
ncbi:MAG: hypothetical protein ACJ8R9_20245 [Steroidobacteraceae bacterium]